MNPADDDAPDFTPFVGLLLLLFLFFIVASSFLEEAKGIAVELPAGDASQAIARDSADTVTFAFDEQIGFQTDQNEQMLTSLDELEEKLKTRADPKRPVLLRCDRRCTYEQIVRLKNVVRNAGVAVIFEEMAAPQ